MYIAATLEQKNPEVEVIIIDAQAERMKPNELIVTVKQENPDILGIITDGLTIGEDIVLLKKLKENCPMLQSVIMGTIATAYPKTIIHEESIDYVIRGEPEYTFSELVRVLNSDKKLESVNGLSFKKNKKIIHNKSREQIKNLDSLPFPVRHHIDSNKYHNPFSKRKNFTTILSSRGCPFQCTFCTAPAIYGNQYRFRSAENIVDEIEDVMNRYDIHDFFFRDENLTLMKKQLLTITQEICKRNLDISWMCNSRVDTIDRESLKAMKRSGCYLIKFGVESASQDVLNALKKGVSINQIKKAFKLTKELQIESVAHFMMGSPKDTIETIKSTIKFAKELDPTYASFDLTRPLPGTKLFESLIKQSEISISSFDLESKPFNEMLTGIKQTEINKLYYQAYKSFYLRPVPLLRIVRKMGIKCILEETKNYFVKYKGVHEPARRMLNEVDNEKM